MGRMSQRATATEIVADACRLTCINCGSLRTCACFTAARATFGTASGAQIAAAPALAACNAAYGGCYAACAAATLLPTP